MNKKIFKIKNKRKEEKRIDAIKRSCEYWGKNMPTNVIVINKSTIRKLPEKQQKEMQKLLNKTLKGE